MKPLCEIPSTQGSSFRQGQLETTMTTGRGAFAYHLRSIVNVGGVSGERRQSQNKYSRCLLRFVVE